MEIQLRFGEELFKIDPCSGVSIAIDLMFNGPQPNHFGVADASSRRLESGEFIGDTSIGGSCNVEELTLVPHCNGTHTETVGHIVNDSVPVGKKIDTSFLLATLITVTPSTDEKTETYTPALQQDDKVITARSIDESLGDLHRGEALIVRTKPNDETKKQIRFGPGNLPPFFTNDAIELISELNFKHLLVDVPSLDRTYDEGKLTNHHLFWNVSFDSRKLNDKSFADRTITEFVFVPNEFSDGVYCLMIQLPAFISDAAPSRPILFEMS